MAEIEVKAGFEKIEIESSDRYAALETEIQVVNK
jgi:hypothetical protein